MPKSRRGHLDYSDRCVIEDGIRDGLSASEIARRIGVSTTTVTREVLANRTARPPRKKVVVARKYCASYAYCRRKESLCDPCEGKGARSCRRCATVRCYTVCPDFELATCERTERWPYVCSCGGGERTACPLCKLRYRAREADEASKRRRSSSRGGVSLSQEELAAMMEVVAPLIRQGLSPEAVWEAHGGELPVGVRTFYNYVEAGVVDVASIELPRKVRYRPRKKARRDAPFCGIAAGGGTYAEFLALGEEDRDRAVQVDSVLGYARNEQRVLSLYVPGPRLQLYMLLPGPGSAHVVSALDAIEGYCGGRAAFEDAFGILLADRGSEFSDVRGIERSATEPGGSRCRVFFCDPMSPSQKAGCERGHVELRRVLPKGRSDFDALSFSDVSRACSHVNSYPRRGLGGKCPIDLAAETLPPGLLDSLGVEKVPADGIVLNATLLPHAVRL